MSFVSGFRRDNERSGGDNVDNSIAVIERQYSVDGADYSAQSSRSMAKAMFNALPLATQPVNVSVSPLLSERTQSFVTTVQSVDIFG